MTDMDDESHPDRGGESGGTEPESEKLVMRRSELAVLRRLANKYPILHTERAEVVENVMEVLRTSKSRRHRLSAAKTMAALDRVNHEELKVVAALQEAGKDESGAGLTINVNQVNATIGMTVEQFRALPVSEQARLLKG